MTGAAKAAGLDGVLNGATPYTVFAPNNAAFNKIPADSINALTADKAKMTGLLNYHVVPGKVTYSDLAGMTSITTVDGKTLPVARQADGTINVGGAKVLGQGIDSSNGMVYPVDSVMMPPGFVMPAAAPSQGIPWGWIVLGAVVLGALAYLLTRPRRHAEPTPRTRHAERAPAEKARPGYEERDAHRRQTTRRPEETMRAGKRIDGRLQGAADRRHREEPQPAAVRRRPGRAEQPDQQGHFQRQAGLHGLPGEDVHDP